MAASGRMVVTRTALTAAEQRALQEFVEYLQLHFATQVKQISLFGSKARGDSGQNSDIDVLIIQAREDRPLRRKILKQAARLSLKYDVLLSPRVIGMERWEQMHGFSLYQNIQREALDLPVIKST